MRILCDVCENKEASVFCAADDAALCVDCDNRVHHANKLASKHQRLSIERKSSEESNLCDICKERRALLFCKQDRAILCRDCDVSIHKTNKLTQMHTKYLLVGLEVAVAAASSGCNSSMESDSVSPNVKSMHSEAVVPLKKAASVSPVPVTTTADSKDSSCLMNGTTISDHLRDMLPGWHFEDYSLDSSLAASYVIPEEGKNEQVLPIDFQANLCSFPSQDFGFWVPQSTLYHQPNHSIDQQFESITGNKDNISRKLNKRWIEESLVPDTPDCFQVPVSFSVVPSKGEHLGSKKSRFF